MFDFWVAQGDAKNAVSLREGLQNRFGKEATTTFCCGLWTDGVANEALIAEAVSLAETADVLLVNVGLSGKMAGEDRSAGPSRIPAPQVALLQALKRTGKPIVVFGKQRQAPGAYIPSSTWPMPSCNAGYWEQKQEMP